MRDRKARCARNASSKTSSYRGTGVWYSGRLCMRKIQQKSAEQQHTVHEDITRSREVIEIDRGSRDGNLLRQPALLPEVIIAYKQNHQRANSVQNADGQPGITACFGVIAFSAACARVRSTTISPSSIDVRVSCVSVRLVRLYTADS